MFCGSKKCKSCKAARAPPQAPLGELCIPLCWDDRGPAYPSLPLRLHTNPRCKILDSAPLFVWGGGGGGGIIALCPRALNNHTTPLHCVTRASISAITLDNRPDFVFNQWIVMSNNKCWLTMKLQRTVAFSRFLKRPKP